MLAIPSGSAFATVQVMVWTGAPNGVDAPVGEAADLAHKPTGTPDAVFTYTGPINWVDNASQNHTSSGFNLFKNFLTIADITGFSSPNGTYTGPGALTAFGNASMSVDGNANLTYMYISGSYFSPPGGTAASISHDDGASLYIDGNPCTLLCFPGQTTETTGFFTLPAGSHNFVLTYVESNGSPSDLIFNTGRVSFSSTVPEPSTWAMMLIGFAGVGFVAYRRTKKSSAAFLAA